MTLDHSALWSMYASLEELRGKIGHVLKCAIQMSKVAWSNVIAKRCRGCSHLYSSRIREGSFSEIRIHTPASPIAVVGVLFEHPMCAHINRIILCRHAQPRSGTPLTRGVRAATRAKKRRDT